MENSDDSLVEVLNFLFICIKGSAKFKTYFINCSEILEIIKMLGLPNFIGKVLIFTFLIYASLYCNSRQRMESNNQNLEVNTKGKVIGIVDGDTYDVLINENITVRIRMEGIDAPERGMPFYKVSKQYLSDLCFGKFVTIRKKGVDKHDRILAYSYLNDSTELSHEMLRAGMAWHFKKYNNESDLSDLEKEARMTKRGLWAGNNAMQPWENRRLHRSGISTIDSFGIGEVQQ